MPRVCKTCGREAAEAAYCPFCSEPTVKHVPVRLSRSYAMTLRTMVEREKRMITIVSLCGTLLTLGGMLLGILLNILLNISMVYSLIPFLAGLVITILYVKSYAFRCPRCDKDLVQLVRQGNLVGTDQNIRFCPFCGLDLDAQIDPKSHESTEFLEEKWAQRPIGIKSTGIQLPPDKQKASTDIQLPPRKEEK